MPGNSEFAVSAELLRRGRDIPSMVRAVGSRLEKAMPGVAELTTRRLRRTTDLVVRLRPEQYRIELRGERPTCWIDHVVRDVSVRSQEVDIDQWLSGLAAALENEAMRSTAVRLALAEAFT